MVIMNDGDGYDNHGGYNDDGGHDWWPWWFHDGDGHDHQGGDHDHGVNDNLKDKTTSTRPMTAAPMSRNSSTTEKWSII